MNYYIFGAHSRGYTLFEYMRMLEPQDIILGFLFDDDQINPEDIEGICVYDLKNLVKNEALDTNAKVYIATHGDSHDRITQVLGKLGFIDIIPVTHALDTELRNKYIKKRFNEQKRKYIKISELSIDSTNHSSIEGLDHDLKCVYIAKHAKDSDFQKPVNLEVYELIIQVGCAINDDRLPEANYFDDISLNGNETISGKNKQFCELTALYWIWKHSNQDIVGLEHWRRRFILPDNWHTTMKSQDVDAILPVPLCVMPSLEKNYKSRHLGFIWDKLFEIMANIHPDEVESAKTYFENNNIYSPCNMIIAKKSVIDGYCEWLFPMLLRLSEEIGTIDDSYQNRYPGFISERLLTYYFDVHRDKYSVVYADKSFLK